MTDLNALKVLAEKATPGSDAAVALGCKCPRMDNAYGRGWMGGVKDADGDVVFVITDSCPVHHIPLANLEALP